MLGAFFIPKNRRRKTMPEKTETCEGCEESAEILEASPLPVDDEENAADLPQDPDSVANLDQEEAE
jgi:hypothetical protein